MKSQSLQITAVPITQRLLTLQFIRSKAMKFLKRPNRKNIFKSTLFATGEWCFIIISWWKWKHWKILFRLHPIVVFNKAFLSFTCHICKRIKRREKEHKLNLMFHCKCMGTRLVSIISNLKFNFVFWCWKKIQMRHKESRYCMFRKMTLV